MRLTLFQSGKGDCLLLTSASKKTTMLIDGGMPAPYRRHVAPALGALRKAKQAIDVVYVSHIDEDHIGGVLELLNDEVAWRVHAHQRATGNTAHPAPASPRPPAVGQIWHNAFHELLAKNAGPIADALAAAAPILSASDLAALRDVAQAQSGLVSSVRQAIQVSRRIGARQLNIPLNAPAAGRLMMAGQPVLQVGALQVTILGPTPEALQTLRDEWNDWLRRSEAVLRRIEADAARDQDRLGTGDLGRLLARFRVQAEAFGNPKSVTPPNLASLTLLIEDGPRSLLLTGDARWDQIVDGLTAAGRLAPGRPLVVDIVKVPHHGSKNNVKETTLLDNVVGTHYLFCGNGDHGNPHPEVVELMAARRLQAPGRFKFWFNCSVEAADSAPRAAHMRAIEALVTRLVRKSGGRMASRFLRSGSHVTIR